MSRIQDMTNAIEEMALPVGIQNGTAKHSLTVPPSNHDPWHLPKSAKCEWEVVPSVQCLSCKHEGLSSIHRILSKLGLVDTMKSHCWRVSNIWTLGPHFVAMFGGSTVLLEEVCHWSGPWEFTASPYFQFNLSALGLWLKMWPLSFLLQQPREQKGRKW